MVQVLAANPRPSFSEKLGAGIGEALPEEIQKFSEHLKLKRENEALKDKIGMDLSGIEDPQTRQQLIADQLTQGRKMKQAQALQNVSLGQQGQTPSTPRSKASQGTKEVSTGEARNFPKEATTGVPVPIMTPDETIAKGQRIAAERTNAGVPTSPEEGIAIADSENERNFLYNKQVEADNEKRVNKQREYGEQAEAKLLKLYPEATDEQRAIFKQKAENLTQEGNSEADIDKTLAREATKFKNTIANVKKSVVPKRLGSRIKSKFLGTERELEQEKNSLRVAIKPLIDEGLNDTARMILSDNGYYPEEIESVITELPEQSRKLLATLPKIENKKASIPMGIREAPMAKTTTLPLTDKQRETFFNNFNSVLKADPSVNLVLLRKAYRDKNIDWADFKDAYDLAVINGFEPTDDQQSQSNKLNSAPLDNLDKLLYNMGLIGI